MLKIDYHNRDLTFDCEGYRGTGLQELIVYSADNRGKIKQMCISGDSVSYTFERQLYLFINLFSKISRADVTINGRHVGKRQVFPNYINKI
jgi:hypothetical protein